MPKEKEFRVHHILCTQLYQGLGYSGDFCTNMTAVVSDLRTHPKQRLRLVAKGDVICANCPNRVGADQCTNGDNHVVVKDRDLLEPLHLIENESYTYSELLQHSHQYLTESVFVASCANCNWYKQGICKYEDFSQLFLRVNSCNDFG
ncbi:MAG: DUF1284 domain-containing protein [Lachnobacterium sp.]|nr:DUF1284 domain-containing protein [Lachnobacterium sp.]MCI7531528.1 DUF1284 domain-containing protein [Lachnobacterium sp.]